MQLLIRDPEERLSDPKKIKDHPFFGSIDWDKLAAKELTPPFIPPVKVLIFLSPSSILIIPKNRLEINFFFFLNVYQDAADIGMIDTEFTDMDVNAVETGGGEEVQPNFDGFTYVADSELA